MVDQVTPATHSSNVYMLAPLRSLFSKIPIMSGIARKNTARAFCLDSNILARQKAGSIKIPKCALLDMGESKSIAQRIIDASSAN